MRVFVYEHLCTLPALASSLRAEGQAMLVAALTDLCACEGVEPVAMVDPALISQIQSISPRLTVLASIPGSPREAFRAAARGGDFALVIAPEFDDILATRAEWALAAGCRLLGPSPEAIRLCADKLRLAEFLRPRRIPVPETARYDRARAPADGYPRIVKPRSGAGSTATFLARSPDEYAEAAARARAQGYEGELIAQPFHRGEPASVALILRGFGDPVSLLPAEQHIREAEGQLRYAGGAVQHPSEFLYAAILAECAARAVPGLWGYVGVDLVFDRFASVVLEINPRLTTSYVGLRRLSQGNLMQALLDMERGKDAFLFQPTWRDGRIRFDPDGTIHESEGGAETGIG